MDPLKAVYCGKSIRYCREGCMWTQQDGKGALGSNYRHGNYVGYSFDFVLVASSSMKGIMGYRRV